MKYNACGLTCSADFFHHTRSLKGVTVICSSPMYMDVLPDYFLLPMLWQGIGERCFDEGMYEAARLLFKNIHNNAKLALCLVHLGQYREAVEAATKANAVNTWKQVCRGFFSRRGIRVQLKCTVLSPLVCVDRCLLHRPCLLVDFCDDLIWSNLPCGHAVTEGCTTTTTTLVTHTPTIQKK